MDGTVARGAIERPTNGHRRLSLRTKYNSAVSRDKIDHKRNTEAGSNQN